MLYPPYKGMTFSNATNGISTPSIKSGITTDAHFLPLKSVIWFLWLMATQGQAVPLMNGSSGLQ